MEKSCKLEWIAFDDIDSPLNDNESFEQELYLENCQKIIVIL